MSRKRSDQMICKEYAKNGKCRYGKGCFYLHVHKKDKENLNNKSNNEVDNRQICRDYQKGQCEYGERCRYKHVEKRFNVNRDFERRSSFKNRNDKGGGGRRRNYGNRRRLEAFSIKNVDGVMRFFDRVKKSGPDCVDMLYDKDFYGVLNFGGEFSYRIALKIIECLTNDVFLNSHKQVKVIHILKKFSSSKFNLDYIDVFIEKEIVISEDINGLVKLFYNCLKLYPKSFSDLERNIDLLRQNSIEKFGNDEDVKKDIKRLIDLKNYLINQQRESKLGNKDESNEIEKSTEDFKKVLFYEEAVPRKDELTVPPKIEVPPENDMWKKVSDYLYHHFRIIKEDFVHKLRKGLKDYQEGVLDIRDMPTFPNINKIVFTQTR